ncbi:hypothetical protein [Pseudomonas brenneri]
MSLEIVLTWLEAHPGLAAWMTIFGGTVVWVASLFFRGLSREVAKRKAAKSSAAKAKEEAFSGAIALEDAASEFVRLAEAANNAGTKERQDLASRVEGHFEIVKAIEQQATTSEMKGELARACRDIKDFQHNISNWHGEDDCDTSQQEAGKGAIDRIQRSAAKLKQYV